jgi:hypothetical protein
VMGRLRVVLRMAVTARMGEKSQVCFYVADYITHIHALLDSCLFQQANCTLTERLTP